MFSRIKFLALLVVSDQFSMYFIFSSMITISVRGTKSFQDSWSKRYFISQTMGNVLNLRIVFIVLYLTNCIYHAKFLRFLNCRVSNTKNLHDWRTWWNSENLICTDTKMKQLGVFDSLGITNDQIKHLSRVVFLGR